MARFNWCLPLRRGQTQKSRSCFRKREELLNLCHVLSDLHRVYGLLFGTA